MQQVSAYIAGALTQAAAEGGRREDQASRARHDRGDGVGLAAAAGEESDRLRENARRREGSLRDRLAASSPRPINAALANGMLAHADETDDSHAPSLCHPGCAIVPAALAMAERERRNGAALVARGRARLRRRPPPEHVAAMPTNSATPATRRTASARRSARPLPPARSPGLNADQARSLLSYTAQQASGVSCWMRDEEHIEKAFDFGGMPARNGVAAATMVAHGFTGVDDVFSGERNFFVAYDETRRIGRAPEPQLLVHGSARPTRS